MAEDKKRDFGWIIPVFIIGIAVSVAILMILAVTRIDHKKETSTADVVSAVTATPAVVEQASEDQLLNAMLFSYVITKVCHDKKNNIWFMYIPDHPHNEHRLDGGWYKTDSFEYRILENNSIIITEEKEWTRVAVDITGLSCKEQKVDMSFFNN